MKPIVRFSVLVLPWALVKCTLGITRKPPKHWNGLKRSSPVPRQMGGVVRARIARSMATWRTVRLIALELPESAEKMGGSGTATWTVRGKSFAWERPLRRSDLEALGDAAPAGAILGIRTPDLEMKDALLLSDPAVFFTTPHFEGYPAVLIVLAKITTATLRDVLLESWLARAPKRVADAFLAGRKPASK